MDRQTAFNLFFFGGLGLITLLTYSFVRWVWNHRRIRRMVSIRVYTVFIAVVLWITLFGILLNLALVIEF